MGARAMRLLLVENEPQLAAAVRAVLESEGCEVVLERTGEGGFFRGVTEGFDAILLDVTLPGRDGWQILAALRQEGIRTPVLIMVGAGGADPPGGSPLRSADDVLVKPFGTAELVTRVQGLAPREGPLREHPVLPRP
jgi:DNA-binding response OmpR family regulator